MKLYISFISLLVCNFFTAKHFDVDPPVSFNESPSTSETVIAVWDFVAGSTAVALGDGFTTTGENNLGWLKNGDQSGVSDPNSVVQSGRNGFSGDFLQGIDIAPSDLIDGKLHVSISYNKIDLTGTGAVQQLFLKGLGNSNFGTNHRMVGLKLTHDATNSDIKVESIVLNNGMQFGTIKDQGGLGNSSVYSDQITLGTTMDFINGTSSFWVGSPGENTINPYGLTMATNDENQSTNWDAATVSMAPSAVLKLLKFNSKNGDGYVEVDQFKISTGTYENTVDSGDSEALVANNMAINVFSQTPTNFTFDVNTNFSQANLTYEIVQQPLNGTVTVQGNTATYTPNSGYIGADSLVYRAFNGYYYSNESTVSINVFDAPNLTVTLDATQINEGESSQITFTIDQISEFDVTIDFSGFLGTAESSDYEITSDGQILSQLTIPAGETEAEIQIQAIEDQLAETSEFINLLFNIDGAVYDYSFLKLYINGNAPIFTTFISYWCPETQSYSVVSEIYVSGTYNFNNDNIDFTDQENDNHQLFTDFSSQSLSSLGTVSDSFVYFIYTNNESSWNQNNNFPSINSSNSIVLDSNDQYISQNYRYRIYNTETNQTIDQFGIDTNSDTFWFLETYAKRINNTGPDYGYIRSNWSVNNNYTLQDQGFCYGGDESVEDYIGGLGIFASANNSPTTSDIYNYTLVNNSTEFDLYAEDETNQNELSYNLISMPSNGTAVLTGNTITYTPNTDFQGEDIFSFQVFDGEFYSNISNIVVGVTTIPNLTIDINTNEIAEHEAAVITATLDAPGPYDIEIDLSSIEGTASQDDFTYVSSNFAGTRYIKFEAYYSSDDGQVNLREIEALLADGTNVACGKSGYSNSYENEGWEENGYYVTDCQEGGRWSSNRDDPGPSEQEPHYIVVDLEDVYDLDSIKIVGDEWYMSFSVLVSADGVNWENLGTYTNYYMGNVTLTDIQSIGFIIKSGETTAIIYVQGVEDNVTEGTETLTINTPVVENANLLNPQAFSIDILDVVTTFTLRDNIFAGFSNAEFAWGDYDLDGDMDVAIMGDQGNGVETTLYRNDIVDGEHIFVDSQQNFESIGYGTLKWVDLNKDGLIDLFVSGIGASGVNSFLYRNTTNIPNNDDFVLEDSYEFPNLFQSDIDFGDLDNDGDVDYAINGTNQNGQQVSYYGFQSDDGSFEIVDSNFGTFTSGAIKIFDVNSDGDNDLISSSGNRLNNYFSSSSPHIYPGEGANFEELEFFISTGSNTLKYLTIGNNGNPSTISNLENSNFSLGFVNGDFSIADYNNDGYEDIFITGANVSDNNPDAAEVSSTLYQGSISGHNTSSEFNFQGFSDSSVEWIDYDNDGDLDLFLSGFAPGLGQKTYLYEVEVTNKKNTPPGIISTLNFDDLGDGYVELSWEKPEDDFNAIMGYNLRLGTSPGGDELSYLLSDLENGQLMVNQTPSIIRNNYTIQLDPGIYYWSVQAVDKGYKGGPFSSEQSFTLTYDWKILNQGGIIDKSIPAIVNPILEFMDLDNDGDYDILYGQSGSSLNVYSYEDNFLTENQSYNLISGFDDIEVGDINLDGKFDVVGKVSTNSNPIYLSNDNLSDQAFTSYNFETPFLFDRKLRLSDLNNDGNLDIINFGLDSENEFLANFEIFSTYYDPFNNYFFTTNLSENFAVVSQMFSPSFDVGDFDNDQDIDVVISGDQIFGPNITKIFENTTETGSQTIVFEEYLEANLPGVKDGSTDFLDFDSDGDLDLILSGFNDLGEKVFSMYENVDSGEWPIIETNLPEMTNTQLDFGDFNADGLSDLLISGTNISGVDETKLMEYAEGIGFVESDYDLSDFTYAKFAFGDLDGDSDLDFVITGESAINSQPLVRVYLNYRSESYAVANAGSRLSSNSENVYNQAPSVPIIDNVSVESVNSDDIAVIKIEWSQSIDDNTPSNAISYALKIGTTSGGENIVSSGALASGQRKIAGNGNSEYNTSWNIALVPGDYYVAVQSIDASFVGSEFSSELMFTVYEDNSLGLDENIFGNISVFPNPTNSMLNIFNSDNSNEIMEVNLYDIVGKRYNFNNYKNSSIDLSFLSVGVYILEIIFDNKQVLKRKVIKK